MSGINPLELIIPKDQDVTDRLSSWAKSPKQSDLSDLESSKPGKLEHALPTDHEEESAARIVELIVSGPYGTPVNVGKKHARHMFIASNVNAAIPYLCVARNLAHYVSSSAPPRPTLNGPVRIFETFLGEKFNLDYFNATEMDNSSNPCRFHLSPAPVPSSPAGRQDSSTKPSAEDGL